MVSRSQRGDTVQEGNGGKGIELGGLGGTFSRGRVISPVIVCFV